MAKSPPRYKKEEKKKKEFSKFLSGLDTIVYICTLIFCMAVWYIKGDFPSEIFKFVTGQYVICRMGYVTKSGVENYVKINSVNKESEE